ncbi:hypothetical protein BT96DRAFT_931478 [Gymnopus androsaceus JB14]|uniref:Uncharacterized protein n=1 Tax=Gymnopus androsaceus JB14 TaxID=1447944 RepID=A0A6A4IMD3_9AGAR|nr:hypothetical protein BT96DRAFT_931478 [Gymnopus androsaceus JB14]
MASTMRPANVAEMAPPNFQHLQAQVDPESAARARTVNSMLSGFANEFLQELGCHPNVNMAQEMASLKEENAALKQQMLQAKADISRLWQDNEALDRRLKRVVPQRDHYYSLLLQSPSSLSAICLKLEEENARIRMQHHALVQNTQRLVEDGLSLGVLLKTDAKSGDGQSTAMNVHFRRPQQVSQSDHHSHYQQPPTLHAVPSQVPINRGQQSRQPQRIHENARRQPLPSHSVQVITQQAPSQPQYVAHRSNSTAGSPAEQKYLPTPSPTVHQQTFQTPAQVAHFQQFDNTQQQHHSPNHHPQLGAHRQPQPPFRSVTVPHSIQGINHPKRSLSSPHPLSQIQVPPPSLSVPLESQALGLPIPHRHTASPESQSPLDAQILNTAYARPIAPVEQSQASGNHDMSVVVPARSERTSDLEVILVDGPAPPTPPQSVKSLSPEQEYCTVFPEPRKRGSVDMEDDDATRRGSPKRMRRDEPAVVDTPVQSTSLRICEEAAVVHDVHMEQDVVAKEREAAADPPTAAASATEPVANVETAATPAVVAPEVPQSVVTSAGSHQTDGNAQAEGSDDEEEDEEEETKEDAIEELFIHERSKRICTLCRERSKRDGDKHTDTFFERDTSTFGYLLST